MKRQLALLGISLALSGCNYLGHKEVPAGAPLAANVPAHISEVDFSGVIRTAFVLTGQEGAFGRDRKLIPSNNPHRYHQIAVLHSGDHVYSGHIASVRKNGSMALMFLDDDTDQKSAKEAFNHDVTMDIYGIEGRTS